METKYLWDIIDKLRDELRDMKKENDTLDSSLKECVNEYNKLEKENDSLKDEAIKWNRKYNKLNANYNNDIDASYELDDKHIEIIKDLEEEIKTLKDSSHHPKEYQKESEEYFHHNEDCKELLFFMVEGEQFNNDEFSESLYKDDAICTIYKS